MNYADQRRKRFFWTGLLIVFILIVFGNTLMPAAVSSSNSGRALTFAKGLLSDLGLNSSWITDYIIRKTAHFTEYFILGILLLQNYRVYVPQKGSSFVIILWGGLLIPFIDETLQLFTEGRSGQISDVWLDYSGVICGIMLLLILGRLPKRAKRRRRIGNYKLRGYDTI